MNNNIRKINKPLFNNWGYPYCFNKIGKKNLLYRKLFWFILFFYNKYYRFKFLKSTFTLKEYLMYA